MNTLLSLVFAASLATCIGYILVTLWGLSSDYFYNKVQQKTPINRREYLEYHKTLCKHIDFYNNLSTSGKAKFVNKTVKFFKTKRFFAREGLKLTKEMAILISGAAAQLSYGIEGYYFSHIDLIHVYPKNFYFRLLNARLKGATSEGGTMYFSWLDLEKGYAIEDDKYNLALHELAHALKISSKHDTNFSDRFAPYLNRWEKIGQNEFDSIKSGHQSFLRKYAGTNKQEFFAVCVEHFFEASKEFSQKLPEIYDHLCVLLNQNPKNKDLDYRLDSNHRSKLGYKAKKWAINKVSANDISNDSWHWSLSVLIFGICISPWIIIGTSQSYLLSAGNLWILLMMLIMLGGIVNYKTLVKSNFMDYRGYSTYLALGFAPTMLAFILSVNLMFDTETTTTTYKTKGYYSSGSTYYIVLEGDSYLDTPQDVEVNWRLKGKEKLGLKNVSHLKITTTQGVFLLKNHVSSEPVYSALN